jgi:hypothetical protein
MQISFAGLVSALGAGAYPKPEDGQGFRAIKNW